MLADKIYTNLRAAEVLSRFVLELGDAISGISRVPRTYLKIADCCRSDNNVE
jgi:hypothetical protein